MAVEYAQVAVTAGTLVLGAGIAFVADARQNGWLDRRERVAAERHDERERRAFERATLIELQDWLAKLTRATGAIHHADEMEFRSSQRWGLPTGEWSDRQSEAIVNVNRLRVRLPDADLRAQVEEFTSICIAATMGRMAEMSHDEAREMAVQARTDAMPLGIRLSEAVGERLRVLA
jgi:hypothetical protein